MGKKWENTFSVGLYKCEMTYSEERGLRVEWLPGVPEFEALSPQEMQQYRLGRDNLLAEVGKAMGGQVLIAEFSDLSLDAK